MLTNGSWATTRSLTGTHYESSEQAGLGLFHGFILSDDRPVKKTKQDHFSWNWLNHRDL